MRGKECNAVVYSEYSGDMVFDEKDRCMMDNILSKSRDDWLSFTTCAEKGTEAILDMKVVEEFWGKLEEQNQDDIKRVSAMNPKMLRNKYKGEKKLLKIIVKNKITGKQQCVDIPKRMELDVVNLKVGMVLYYQKDISYKPELVEIVKIIDDRPTTPPPYWTPYPWQKGLAYSFNYPRGAGKKSLDELIKRNEERAERKEYREKPYFNVRLDPIKGQSDGKENLEKMKFPCWVTFRYGSKDKIGMLVTGCPGLQAGVEYQLIDMMEQVPYGEVSTVFRDKDLKALMEKCSIEVIKGESQLWKIGGFNV